MQTKTRAYYLPVIVLAQFMGTSVWFAGNAVINDIAQTSGTEGIANSTSFVQFGFITGTLLFSLLSIADRFRPSVVFLCSSLLAALANLLLLKTSPDFNHIGLLRFTTGFFLAGIYPVGMKIAADCFPKQLGNALGFLVGALVLGTALPHLLKSAGLHLPWRYVLTITSIICAIGGIAVFSLVPTHSSDLKNKTDLSQIGVIFRGSDFRRAAFGYFGHMWELYTFWTFIPLLVQRYNEQNGAHWNISLTSFLIIASGCLSCIIGGIISKRKGSRYIASNSLFISGICCLLAPFSFYFSQALFIPFLFVWGTTVVSDSPQFSTLVAQAAPAHYKGTALTLVTCIGFFLTILSIQLLKWCFPLGVISLWLLVPGPVFGWLALRSEKRATDK